MGNSLIQKVKHYSKSPDIDERTERSEEVSRSNFYFIQKLWTTGHDNESIIWLAENRSAPQKRFFIKESNKLSLENHNRIESLHSELSLLTKQKHSNICHPEYAFQDYQSLYLVFKYIECFTLEQVLRQHAFTQQQAKYVIISLIKIVQYFHQQKYAITELCPSNLIIDQESGRLQLMELINPLPIDQFYPSHTVTKLNPYSAPEILAMDEVLAESDYFSIGLILYEILKQSSAIPRQISHDRKAIIEEKIQVVKSDLPEGWKPEATDFLVKLLIKNPQLRLGKYGSYEVCTHPWLHNCTETQSFVRSSIHLVEPYFQEKKLESLEEKRKQKKCFDEKISSWEFQQKFEKYSYQISKFGPPQSSVHQNI